MRHHADDRITLVAVTHGIDDGFSVRSETTTEVWADRKSVTRSEYYKATQAGMRADVVFEIHAMEYAGQSVVRLGADTYDVIRSYQTEPDKIELTCARRGAKT